MFKLVVLSALLAFASAKPSVLHHGAAVLPSAVSHQSRTDFISSPVVSSYSAVATPLVQQHLVAAPVVHQQSLVAAAPVVQKVITNQPAIAYAAVPVTGTAYSQNVHYAEKDVVTGYSQQILKPNLGALATPAQIVSKSNVLAPARAIQTLTPTVTRVEPQVTVNKVTVDVPVHTPVVSEVEVRTPHVVAQPIVPVAQRIVQAAPVAYSAVAHQQVAPVVSVAHQQVVAAAPAVSVAHQVAPLSYSYGSALSYAHAAPVLSSAHGYVSSAQFQHAPIHTQAKYVW